MLAPGLYLVATPLGNLGDLSPRAREVLSRAFCWATESHSAAGRWVTMLERSERPRILSYREATRDRDAQKILERLGEGDSVALISDAGTPCLSDPGWHLVDLVRQAGFAVYTLPGPCAAIAALTLSGFPCRRFLFEGFLPTSGKARREALERLGAQSCPVILYESSHRLLDTLTDLKAQTRPLYIGRELTKKFEESWRGCSSEAAEAWQEKRVQGEFTLVLGPLEEESAEQTSLPEESVSFLRSLALPTKTTTAILKHFFPQASKKELYALLLSEKE